MYQIADIKNKIFEGDSKNILQEFPSKCIDLIVTSPPYFKLRDYNHENQIGTEDKPDYYISNLWVVFAECKRVLKDTGSIFVNIADSYYNKSLIGIPEQFVIMMIKSLGLYHRNTIIWEKNAMPESPKDRYSNNFEYMYFFTKSQKYKFKTQYQPYAASSLKQVNQIYKGQAKKDYKANGVQNPSDTKRRIITSIKFGGSKYPKNVSNNTYSGNAWQADPDKGARKKCIWKIATNNTTEEHYASYPEALIESPIDACTDKGDIILDPFIGSGTTAIKARKLERSYVGIDINSNYVNITNKRLGYMIENYV